MTGDVDIHDDSLWNLERFTQVDRRNNQGFTVLGDCPPRPHNSLLAEDFRDAGVGERLLAILGAHQLLDQRPDRGTGSRATTVSGDMAAEKIFKFECAT